MSEPKKPQDRKPKATDSVTVRGISLTIPKSRLEDWEVIEGVATMQDEDSSGSDKLVASVRTMRRLFGDDYSRVKTELREANGGTLGGEDMGSFLTEVFEAINPN